MRQNKKRGDWLRVVGWNGKEKGKQRPQDVCVVALLSPACVLPPHLVVKQQCYYSTEELQQQANCQGVHELWPTEKKVMSVFTRSQFLAATALSTCTSLGMSSGLFKWCEGTQADKSWLHGGGSSGWGGKTHNATKVKSFTYVVIQGVVLVRRRTLIQAKSIRNTQQNLIHERYLNEMSLILIAPKLMGTRHMLDIRCIQ